MTRTARAMPHADTRLPLWLRVTFYALAHAEDGRLLLTAGELRHAIDPSGTIAASEVSRAIRTAKLKGLLEDASTGRCLVLAGGLSGYAHSGYLHSGLGGYAHNEWQVC